MTKDEFQVSWDAADRRSGSILWSVHICAVLSACLVIALAAAYLAISFFIDYLPPHWDPCRSRIAIQALIICALPLFALGIARMAGAKFPLNREAAERNGFGHFWVAYQVLGVSLFIGLVLIYAFLQFAPALYGLKEMTAAYRVEARWLSLWFSVGGIVSLGALSGFHNWHYRWLTKIGMECPKCGHVLIWHTGERTQVGCTNCGKKCRTTPATGRCDKCENKIFDA